ncbi:MAG: glycosyltransferase family 4 protein [Oscillatoriaceae bacterium SKW80]|nr:glycosyltransferase family 4 protein [Oscillatoriaceae bacterium SKYG93]MCX8120694.1 glycosyltransferase family 4 protein [Oscillatoriaceae bacterium SKW80]MDW8453768.1 glycosyltransferase family 4 protein [Oscillatoriaceae cyanobacterium SKYGB_i_bin93]HIK26998.1 glycosyltransferase family 4 protein [Oscillatoriaceae cyanobacterium M7585_C2015_266]
MKIRKVVVTGAPNFIYRYQFLLKAIASHYEHLEYLPCGERFYSSPFANTIAELVYKIIYKFSLSTADRLFQKNQRAYIAKSRQAEQKIGKLKFTPDLVFQIFGMFSPFWERSDIPYAMYLDYTMALAIKNWSPWAPFKNSQEREAWLECERQTYQKAFHIFPMSNVVKSSLIEDYGVEHQKITVVGSSGNFPEPYTGEKLFGSKQILFNGSDWERKGGDLVVEAFKQVKKVIPEAKLVIIGKKVNKRGEGINNPGKIRSLSELHDLFLKSDLVVAPSYCEPFQEFLLEAMNYGVPCIVSDRDGMPEIVDQEINGMIIEQLTPEALAKNIVTLLNNPERLACMSEAARQKIKTKFNWNSIAEKIVEVLGR